MTEIKLAEGSVIPMRHAHHTLPLMHGAAYFRIAGTQYRWKKHTELIEEGKDVVLATYQADKEDSRRIGTLVVTPEGQHMLNLAVITCLVDQERADEKKYKVGRR